MSGVFSLSARALTTAVLVASVATVTAGPARADVPRPSSEVDVFVGTGGQVPWRSGGTTPAAAAPFGMIQLGPDTTDDAATGEPSHNPAGYDSSDALLRGLSPTHLSGTGCATFGDAPLLPWAGRLPADPGRATVGLRKDTERARPGRYAVDLADGVAVTAAASQRAGLLDLDFPAGRHSFVIVKADGSLAGAGAQRVRIRGDREVAVRVRSGGFCGAENEYVVHVVYRFDRPIRSHGRYAGGAWLGFGRGVDVRVQVAISHVDAAGARRNLDAADPGWSVSRLAGRTAAAWDTELDRIRPSGGTARERRLLRTALYHVLLHPTPISDADGRYPGSDGLLHRLSKAQRRSGELQLSSISGWDMYRTTMPLLAWLRPDVASMTVRSLQRDAQQGGSYPRWPVVAEDSAAMVGDPTAPIAAAAWAFGARDVPLGKLVTGLARQGDDVDGAREGLADYLALGWVSSDEDPHSAARTVEYATADFAISRLAAAAGRPALAARFRERSGQWRNLLDPERGLLAPRAADGGFPSPEVDVTTCCDGFIEGNALQYTFGGVPQDMGGVLAAMGDPAQVAARLDGFFTQLNAGGEPYAWLGNEPSFLTPWTYQWLGAPARTQDVVSRARDGLWSLTPAGLPGNDDLGALSAWYVWSALGLYPLTPGTADAALGTPGFGTVVLRPLGGRATTIVRRGTGDHVAAVRVDGADRSASWLDLSPDARARRIVVTTTTETDPAWGTASTDRPPSHPVAGARSD